MHLEKVVEEGQLRPRLAAADLVLEDLENQPALHMEMGKEHLAGSGRERRLELRLVDCQLPILSSLAQLSPGRPLHELVISTKPTIVDWTL